MLIAYERSFIPEAGYTRGLTYQEYFGMDEKISSPLTINMPESPEDVEQENIKLRRAFATGETKGLTVTQGYDEIMNASMTAMDNVVARTKRAHSRGFGDTTDEMTQALLDAPSGTNYHNFIKKHPDAFQYWLAEQKYANAGTFPDEVKVYREGHVIYESGFETFETAAGKEKTDAKGTFNVRIQMSSTPSGLRYTQSHPSGLGMTISGACDPIVQGK